MLSLLSDELPALIDMRPTIPLPTLIKRCAQLIGGAFYCAALLGTLAANAADNVSTARAVSSGRLSAPQNLILQGIQITENSDNFVIEIELGQALHYMRHFPFASGSNLQIQLQPPQGTSRPTDPLPHAAAPRPADPGAALQAQTPRERLDPPRNQALPLTDIIYEGDAAGGPYLTLRFRNNVEFNVTEGPHGRSMLITVMKKELGKLRSKNEHHTAPVERSSDLPLPPSDKLDNLIDAALGALEDRDYNRAIFFLAQLLQFPTHKHSQLAKELVGMARERRGDLDRAALEYQEYLRLYPDGEDAERVKQRLAAVELNQRNGGAPIRAVVGDPSAEPKPPAGHIDTYGFFSQRYYQILTDHPMPYMLDNYATVTSFLNVTSSYNDNLYDGRMFFNINDIRTPQGTGVNKPSVQTLYLDLTDKDNKRNYLLGRQSSATAGIFGRYDGGAASIQIAPKTQLGLTLGAPLDFAYPQYPADRYFYRALINVGAPTDAWSVDGYFVDQLADRMTDRRAVGGDLRWSGSDSALFSSLDYDVYFHKLNVFTLYGDWRRNDPTHYSINYSLKQYPLLASSNALKEEDASLDNYNFSSYSTFISLPWATKKAIRDKALAVSSLTRSLTLSVIHTVDANNSFNADVSVYSTDAKRSVFLVGPPPEQDPDPSVPPANCEDSPEYCTTAQPKFGPEYSYSLTWMSNNYFVPRDSHSWGVRYNNGGDSTVQSLWIRSRIPYGEKWFVSPRAQFDRAHDVNTNGRALRPSLGAKVDYLWKKEMSLDADINYEYSNSSKHNEDYSRATINFGYNVNF